MKDPKEAEVIDKINKIKENHIPVNDAPEEQSPEALQAQLEAMKNKHMNDCLSEINASLAKHNCEIDVAMVIRKGSIEPQITIISK